MTLPGVSRFLEDGVLDRGLSDVRSGSSEGSWGDDDGPTGWRRIIRRSVGSLNPRVGSFDPPQRLVGVHPGRLLQPTRTSSTGSPTLVALGKHLLISPL
jgi:hypothetical protein